VNYRSIEDLSHIIRNNLYKIPKDVDLIVGVPRSGMLAANILAMNLNLQICDLPGYLNNTSLMYGRTRQCRYGEVNNPSDAKKVLIVDDSVYSGASITEVKQKIDSLDGKVCEVIYCAIYTSPDATKKIDIFFEVVKHPRSFEWNVMHRPHLSRCCVDIDGVLCVDPTDEQNDDGEAYLEFLENAQPLVIPSCRVGHLVTSRLEKYREETEKWLSANGVEYEFLHMLDLPSAAARRRLGCHASFKASVFRKLHDTELFIESDFQQARKIATSSGKYALSFGTQELCGPDFSYALVERKSAVIKLRIIRKIRRVINGVIKNDG